MNTRLSFSIVRPFLSGLILTGLALVAQSSLYAAEPDYGFYQETANVLPAGKLTVDVWNSSGDSVHAQPSQLRFGLGRFEPWLSNETIGGKLKVHRHISTFARTGIHSRRASIAELGAVFSLSDRIGRVSVNGSMFDRESVIGLQVGGLAQMRLPILASYGPLFAMGELQLRDHIDSGARLAGGFRWVTRKQLTVDMWVMGSHMKDNGLFYAVPAAIRVTLAI